MQKEGDYQRFLGLQRTQSLKILLSINNLKGSNLEDRLLETSGIIIVPERTIKNVLLTFKPFKG